MYIRWRAYKIIQRIPAEQRAIFELKLLAGDYLQQRPSFLETSIRQEWKGDYLILVSFIFRFTSDRKIDGRCILFL